MEGQDQPSLRRVGRTHGSADPLWAWLALSFRVVTNMWALGCDLCVFSSVGRFGVAVGPSIHVTLTWQHVIRRGGFSWIGNVIDPHVSCVAASHWLSLKYLD